MPLIENNKGIFSRQSLFQNQTLQFSRLLLNSQIATCNANCNVNINGKHESRQLNMEGSIICIKNKKVIDIQNYFLERITNDDGSIKGINLIKNSTTIEITGDKGYWIDYIRKYTIESNFYDNFKIIELISTGGSSSVYKIKSKIDNNYYAAKRFCRATLEQDNFELQALIKEISLLRYLSYSQLIKFHTTIEDEDYVYLVMDLIKGGELQNSLLLSGISETKTLNLMRQLVQIIYYLHKNNIFHRDIKPQNILLQNQDDFSQIFLCDYGLADEYNQEDNYLFKKCGTPGYTAPEILKEQKYDLRADMFSLGCIMYLAITGKEPFEGKTKDDIVFKNLSGFISLCDIKISNNGKDFLSKLLANNPQDRINVFEAITHPWIIYGPGSHQNCTQNSERIKINSSKFRLKSIKTNFPGNHSRSPQKGFDNELDRPQISRRLLLSTKKLQAIYNEQKFEKKLTV